LATRNCTRAKLPPHFPDLAALISFALVADFERVANGTWLPQL